MRPRAGPNPFLDATAGRMLAQIAARVAGREAIIAADRRITYAQFLREARRFARALLALGVRKDDKNFQGHSWVTIHGESVADTVPDGHFKVVYSYPEAWSPLRLSNL